MLAERVIDAGSAPVGYMSHLPEGKGTPTQTNLNWLSAHSVVVAQLVLKEHQSQMDASADRAPHRGKATTAAPKTLE